MRLRVVAATTTGRAIPIPPALATDYDMPGRAVLAAAPRRAIALVERELVDEPNMLTMRELAIAEDGETGPLVTVTEGETTIRYRAVAAHFEDATTFFPMLGQYEVWQLINLTGDTHPIHVHLDPFQILSRRPIRYEIPEGGIADRDLAAAVTLERDPADSSTTRSTTTSAASRTRSASTPTRSSRSPSASPPTAAATCTTATSSSTRTAT